MKTPQEWLTLRTCALRDGDDPNSDLYKWILRIQKDAFDAGRAKEMLIIAEMVEGQLPKTAQSLRAYSKDLIQPKDTTCSKKGEM